MMAITMAPRAGAFSARYGGERENGATRIERFESFRRYKRRGRVDASRARKLANQRAAQFRKERGAPPVAPVAWRRECKADKGDGEDADARYAARAYDDLPGRRVAEGEEEMTATAGDGLWRVDMAVLSEEDWATQWP